MARQTYKHTFEITYISNGSVIADILEVLKCKPKKKSLRK